ncbi:LysM peptidoglycan-binding domain-containing protein [Amycolatopsis marina]|uniref:LysM peptidoglycan-binding domain-containing protein n=1 Tax=Amycolatopsis marina TaxID=490629 RepID=UPI001FE7D74B|nr:LysM peptidoglycan-binding domain-containing protein [Amycolatopsis marina]
MRRPPTRARVVAGYARTAPATCAPGRRDAVRWPLLVALAVGSALLVVVLGLFAGRMAQADAPVPEQTTLVSVGAGETLADLAARYAPASDTATVVDRIRSLNDLESSAVPAGLPLAVPYQPGLAPASP